jgi:hypothetical protein
VNTITRRSPRLEVAFELFLEHVCRITDDRLRRRLCAALMRDKSQTGVNWRFQVNRLWAGQFDEQLRQMLHGVFRPREIVLWLELSVTTGRLTRADANAAQEAIFPWVGADGQWR